VRAALSDSRYGFCLVLNEHRVVLGLVRQSAIEDAELAAPAEGAREPGPGTVRFNAPAAELRTAPRREGPQNPRRHDRGGCLVGVFQSADAERHLDERVPS
jgi:hypothetical protein